MKSLFTRILSAALLLVAAVSAQAQMVRLHTNLGPIDWTLLNTAPITTANFLSYVRDGSYTNVLIHRSAWYGNNVATPFVIQGGGFIWPTSGACCPQVQSKGTIPNEFSQARSNVRGTVAMAKVGGNPNSATSQWFINMSNNANVLDGQNGGFTVFANVTPPGMVVASRIAALRRVDASAGTSYPFTEFPVVNWTDGSPLLRANGIIVGAITEFAANPSTADRVLNYLEAAFPEYLGSSFGAVTSEALGYQYRYYSGANAYVGIKDGKVWYLVPAVNNNINELGNLADWLATAQAAGY